MFSYFIFPKNLWLGGFSAIKRTCNGIFKRVCFKVDLCKSLSKKKLSWITWINTFWSSKEVNLLKVMLGVGNSFWFTHLVFTEDPQWTKHLIWNFSSAYCSFCFNFQPLELETLKIKVRCGGTTLVSSLGSCLPWLKIWVEFRLSVWIRSVLVLSFFPQRRELQMKVGLYGLKNFTVLPVWR